MNLQNNSTLSFLYRPINRWNEIPWLTFGYVYAGVFGSVFLFPIIFIGLTLTDLLQILHNEKVKSKYQSSLHYSVLFMFLFAIPLIMIVFSLVFFIMGYYLYGFILILLGLFFLFGYSFVSPIIYFSIGIYGSYGWIKTLSLLNDIGGLSSQKYRKLVEHMIISNFIVLLGTILLSFTVIGILLIPLLVLWYLSICSEIFIELKTADFSQELSATHS